MHKVHWGDYTPRAERIAATLEELVANGGNSSVLVNTLREFERLIRRTDRYSIAEPRPDCKESLGDIANRVAPPPAPLPTTLRRSNVGTLRATLGSTLEALRTIEDYGVRETIENLLGGDPEGLLTRKQHQRLRNQQELAYVLMVRARRKAEAKGRRH